MATIYPLPDVPKVKTLLELLFDGLDVKPGKSFDVVSSASWIGLYVSDDGKPVAACAADTALAAHAGAALSMLPANAAKEAIKSLNFSPTMLANLQEIMNICSRLLMSEASPHLRLDSLQSSKALAPEVTTVFRSARGRIDFELTVPKYGTGTLAVMSI